MEWQPIDTAPRDGTWVLLFGFETPDTNDSMDDGWGPVVVGKGGELFAGEGDPWDVGIYDGFCELSVHNPTHWMPLPALPVAECV